MNQFMALLTALVLGAIIVLFFLNFVSALKKNVAAAIFIVILSATCFYFASKI